MSVYKIKPKFRAQILTYIKDKRPHRTYGRNITDAFAKEFLKYGTKEQIAERKKMFIISEEPKKALEPTGAKEPQVEPDTEEDVPTKVTDRMSRKSLNEIATEKGLNPDDYENKKLLAEAINNA